MARSTGLNPKPWHHGWHIHRHGSMAVSPRARERESRMEDHGLTGARDEEEVAIVAVVGVIIPSGVGVVLLEETRAMDGEDGREMRELTVGRLKSACNQPPARRREETEP